MNSISELWENNLGKFGFWLSVFFGASFTVWTFLLDGKTILSPILDGNRAAIYGALASVFGSLLGFTITAESIALGASGHPSLEYIRNSRHYTKLWDVFVNSVRWLGVATMGALLGLVLDRDKNPMYWLTALNVGLFSLGIISLGQCVWILERIIRIISKSAPSTKQQLTVNEK